METTEIRIKSTLKHEGVKVLDINIKYPQFTPDFDKINAFYKKFAVTNSTKIRANVSTAGRIFIWMRNASMFTIKRAK